MTLNQVDLLAKVGLALVVLGPLVSVYGGWLVFRKGQIGVLALGVIALCVGCVFLGIAVQVWQAV
jgi:hypothetical protein